MYYVYVQRVRRFIEISSLKITIPVHTQYRYCYCITEIQIKQIMSSCKRLSSCSVQGHACTSIPETVNKLEVVLEHVGGKGAVEGGGQLDRVVDGVLHQRPGRRPRPRHQNGPVKQA